MDGKTHFEVFGLPRRFDLDSAALEKLYRDRSLQVHPDRAAKGDAKARRIALEQSTALNDAYKTLKDPVRRAFYLLKLHGVDLDKEDGGSAPAGEAMPPEFLEEVIELREQLDAAKQARDVDTAQAMGSLVERRLEGSLDEAVAALRKLEATHNDAAMKDAASQLARVRYFERFLEEVSNIEDEALS